MLLVCIILSTLHSLNLWTGLPSSVITWGQARSKLGGVEMSKMHHYFILYFNPIVDHLPKGEIIAIVIIIVTGLIEIIIIIIPNISTISISVPSHLTIVTCVVIRIIYPLYSVGVDYYFVLNAIEFCWRYIIVSRLFAIHLSPLIMISFMYCE